MVLLLSTHLSYGKADKPVILGKKNYKFAIEFKANQLEEKTNSKQDSMKKVIVISTSLRAGSNSDMLADKFMEGALQAGHEVEKISLIGKDIRFCHGCLACQKLGKCVIQDDVDAIMQKVLHADVIVWATPIYYFEMSGQMKVLIDRMNALYTLDYQFRDVYMLTVAAEEEPEVPQRAEAGLTGWIDCFPKSRLAGTLFCGGVADPRAISGHSKLNEAYEMGLHC